MKEEDAALAARLLKALPKIADEREDCLTGCADEAVVALPELYLPPALWVEILEVAREKVLAKLGTLGITVEPDPVPRDPAKGGSK